MLPPLVKASRFTLTVWTTLALLNIVAGLVISTQPDRLSDFESIARWVRAWLSSVHAGIVTSSGNSPSGASSAIAFGG